MNIKKTKEIIKYLDRIKENLYSNYQNDYLDCYVDIKNANKAKKELLLAGQQEYKTNKDTPLFIEADKWNRNPYVKNIKFDSINLKHFSYKKVLIEKGYLFNADTIQDDKDRELKDYLKLRALDKDIEALFLYQDDEEWMMSVPSESLTNDPYAKKAHGNVITFGLGIGYFTYMTLLNKKVKSITVIENSKEVINLFNKIKGQFPNNDKIKIINGDAYKYFNKKTLDKYDYVYVDIWKSSDDGRTTIEKLLEQYNPPFNKVDFWIEDSCLNVIRTLIYLYYDETVYQRKNKVSKDYKSLMNKVRKYFNQLEIEITKVDTLKDLMYDRKIIRDILAIK